MTVGGPAHDRLLPGDLVLSVDGVPTTTKGAVGDLVRKHRAKQAVTFVVLRDRVRTTVRVVTVESSTQPGGAMVGVGVDTGYRYTPRISFDLGQEIGGPSAGLVFALAIYDKITAGALLDGRHIAGTGTITPTGEVGSIGGIQEKVAAAQQGGATVFLVPAANCSDLAGVRTGLRLVKVATLADSVTALQTLATPGGSARVAGC